MEEVKKFLKSKNRKKVPSPLCGDLTVRITKVTLEGFTFVCRSQGYNTLKFEELEQIHIDRMYGRV